MLPVSIPSAHFTHVIGHDGVHDGELPYQAMFTAFRRQFAHYLVFLQIVLELEEVQFYLGEGLKKLSPRDRAKSLSSSLLGSDGSHYVRRMQTWDPPPW